MRSFDELIQTQDPVWPSIQEWLEEATNSVEVLSCALEKAQEELLKTQVVIRSFMDAVAHEAGDILIDNGWLRTLGPGSTRLPHGLGSRNLNRAQSKPADSIPYYLFANDAAGGYSMINSGGSNGKVGNVLYLPLDILEWEDYGKDYGDLLSRALNGDLQLFYENPHQEDWCEEIRDLNSDSVYTFFPFLWTEKGSDINQVSRKRAPIAKHYASTLDLQNTTLQKASSDSLVATIQIKHP